MKCQICNEFILAKVCVENKLINNVDWTFCSAVYYRNNSRNFSLISEAIKRGQINKRIFVETRMKV